MCSVTKNIDGLLTQLCVCENKTCCNGRFHCPLCPPKRFKPTWRYKVEKHISLSHWKHSIKGPNGYYSTVCYLDNHVPKRHFHCTGCDKCITRKENLVHHMSSCSPCSNVANVQLPTSNGHSQVEDHSYTGRTLACPTPANEKSTSVSNRKLCITCGKYVSISWIKRHQNLHSKRGERATQTRHHTVLIDRKNGIYCSSVSVRGRQMPIHIKKSTERHACESLCESKTCTILKAAALRGGNIAYECNHIASITNAISGKIIMLQTEKLSEMREGKSITEDKLNEATALKLKADEAAVPFVVLIPKQEHTSQRYIHLSVYSGARKYWSLFKRTLVMYDTQKHSFSCRCSKKSKRVCVHSIVGKWFLYQEMPKELSSSDGSVAVDSDVDDVEDDLVEEHNHQTSEDASKPLKVKSMSVDLNYITIHKVIPPEIPTDVFPDTNSTSHDGSTIWPKESLCFHCQVPLLSHILSNRSKVIYMFKVVKGISVGVKTCPKCSVVYRYQEWFEGIHNYNNVTFLGLDLCHFIRCGILNHVSIGRSISVVEDMIGETLNHSEINEAYLHFEALTDHHYSFNCVICGYYPSILIYDTCRKVAFRYSTSDLPLPDEIEGVEETVNCRKFWYDLQHDMLNRGFHNDKEFKIKPRFDFWAPWIGETTRRGDLLFNTEFKKLSKTKSEDEITDAIPEETITNLLLDEKRSCVKRICEEVNVPTDGSIMDMIVRLRKRSISRGEFDRAYEKIFGCSGGWAIGCCPHGIVYSMKSNLRGESPRDFLDLERSLKHRPNVTVCDVSYLLARMGNKIQKDFYFPNEGRLAAATDDAIEATEHGERVYSLPFLDQNPTGVMCEGANPTTGSDVHLALTDWFHQYNCKKREEILRRTSLVDDLCGILDTQVVEQLFSSLKRDLYFMNNMAPTNHIFLFRLLIHLRNEKTNRQLLKKHTLCFGDQVMLNHLGQISQVFHPIVQFNQTTGEHLEVEVAPEHLHQDRNASDASESLTPRGDNVDAGEWSLERGEKRDPGAKRLLENLLPGLVPDSALADQDTTPEANALLDRHAALAHIHERITSLMNDTLSDEQIRALMKNAEYATNVLYLHAPNDRVGQVRSICTSVGWFQTQGATNYCGLCCLNNAIGSLSGDFPVTVSEMDRTADRIWLDMADNPSLGLTVHLEPLRDMEGYYSIEVISASSMHCGYELVRVNHSCIKDATSAEISSSAFHISACKGQTDKSVIVRLTNKEHWVTIKYKHRTQQYLLMDSLLQAPNIVTELYVTDFIRRHSEPPGGAFVLLCREEKEHQHVAESLEEGDTSELGTVNKTDRLYNLRSKKERKRPSSWVYEFPTSRRRHCVCDKTNDGRLYWQCEECQKWYHPACIGFHEEEEPEKFVCQSCLMEDLDFTLRLKISLVKFNKDVEGMITGLRPGQVKALKALVEQKDCLAVLPTGYGKSLIYELLPYIFWETKKSRCMEIVCVPLNAILTQVSAKLGQRRCLHIKDGLAAGEMEKIAKGHITYLIGHPEDFLCDEGLSLLKTIDTGTHMFIVIDEAHCILDWGEDFRPRFKELFQLRAFFQNHSIFAMTATCTKKGQQEICESLHMSMPIIINTTPVKLNIKLNVSRRPASTGGQHTVEESYKTVMKKFLHELYCMGDYFPKTIIYTKLQWCGHAYEYGSMFLGNRMYRVNVSIQNSRIAQYHSPQTTEVNEQVLKALSDTDSPLRMVFATVALGMGADLRDVRRVVHAGPPNSIEEYTQEIGRAVRDGSPAEAWLFYNNTDVASHLKHVSEDIRAFAKNTTKCRREMIADYFSAPFEATCSKQLCCDICAETAQDEGTDTVFLSLEKRHTIRQGLYASIQVDTSGLLTEIMSSWMVEHIAEAAEFLRSSDVIMEVLHLDNLVAESISGIIESVIQQ